MSYWDAALLAAALILGSGVLTLLAVEIAARITQRRRLAWLRHQMDQAEGFGLDSWQGDKHP